MKKGLLTWNILLSLAAIFLLVMHFTSKKGNTIGATKTGKDTAVNGRAITIAYFEMDSLEANFEAVKEFQTELISKEDAINGEMTRLGQAIQQKIIYYQNLDKTGNLSPEQSVTANRELKEMDDQMKGRKQKLDQEYNTFVMTKQTEIKTKIKNFISEYNKTKGFTYIVSDDPGLFYYQDTVYNITSDVIRGLNEKYKPAKKNN
jgi:outer membrane protein